MTEYRNPTPTVDLIIDIGGKLVLIERRNPPHGWALPGGFVDEGEPLWRAAIREAKEETKLDVDLVEQFFCYSRPDRDPRSHTVSTVYIAKASGQPQAADDAKAVDLFSFDDLPSLVFDHAEIVADYLTYRRTGKRPPSDR